MENQEEITQEEGTQEGAGTNRTFIILVAVLGGLLVLGIGAFVAWALLIAPRMREDVEARNQAIFATNTAIAIAAAATETAGVPPTATNTPVPTDTPVPTATSTPLPETPTPEPGTPEATATLSLITPETEGDDGEAIPDTGMGVLGGAALAAGLAFLLILVRRLRRTA